MTLVEVASALARRGRAGDLSADDAARLAAALEADASRLLLVEFTRRVEIRARSLIAAHPLRAGDAVQLASCLHLRDRTGDEMEFIGYDVPMNRAARAEGLRTRGAKISS